MAKGAIAPPPEDEKVESCVTFTLLKKLKTCCCDKNESESVLLFFLFSILLTMFLKRLSFLLFRTIHKMVQRIISFISFFFVFSKTCFFKFYCVGDRKFSYFSFIQNNF